MQFFLELMHLENPPTKFSVIILSEKIWDPLIGNHQTSGKEVSRNIQPEVS